MAEISFFKLNKMTATGKVENIDNINKILLSVTGSASGEIKAVAIDIKEKKMYSDMDIIDMGKIEPTKEISDQEVEMIKQAISDAGVTQWQELYTDPEAKDIVDGFGWMLALEGSDKIVEKHRGSGTSKEKVIPDGYSKIEKIIEDILS